MSNQINVRLAYETLARIMAQAADAEVTVEIVKKEKPAQHTPDAAGR